MKKVFAVLILLFVGFVFYASDEAAASDEGVTEIGEVVVTATRLDTPVREVGNSITVITREEIESKQKSTALEVLREVPGVDVVQSGGVGKTTSIFLRGANSGHTLVLIDGVEMNDPISAGRSYNFANLTVDNIERIEILRGPQSTLYGSDAIGGVINIITRKGKGEPTVFASAEAGSFNTFKESAGVSGGNSKVNYSFEVSRLDTEGISAASEKDGNSERDGYENTSVSARLGITPTENIEVDLILRYIDSQADIDNSAGVGGDDPNRVFNSRQFVLRAESKLFLLNDMWEQKLGVSLSDLARDDRNDPDADHLLDSLRSSFDSQSRKVDWQHNLYLHETNTLIIGLETEEERGKSDFRSESAFGPFISIFDEKKARTNSYYLQDQIKLWGRFFTTVGVRLDDHSKFGTEDTYRVASSYNIDNTATKIKATYGTGFKAPTLFQLFDASSGNNNLAPEKSRGWDVGIEQGLLEDKVSFGITYFHNKIRNLIVWELTDPIFFTGEYKNMNEITTKGFELSTSVHLIENLTFTADYTRTDTKDQTTGEALLRRAKNKFDLNLNYHFLEKGNVNIGIASVGERDDDDFSTFPATRVKLDSYTLVNLAASYNINDNIEIFGRVENLFDEEYEEVKGFGTPGVAFFGGLKITR